MKKEENVVKYYVLCNKLKEVIRTGWKKWNVHAERLESIAEHIYGVQMLAIAMRSEYQYDVDLEKVILMLSVHELEEILIGDLTQFDISKEEKAKKGHVAIKEVLNNLIDGQKIENLILEFDEKETKEAIFAYYCDKLECDLQCKLYGERGLVDLRDQEGNNALDNNMVKSLLNEGLPWEEMWLKFDQENYHFDDNFKAVSNYALNHKISEL